MMRIEKKKKKKEAGRSDFSNRFESRFLRYPRDLPSSNLSTHFPRIWDMAGTGSSMGYSLLLFTVILSLQEVYRTKLASSELFTILGGFTSSLLFLVLLTFIGNFQESCGMKTGWGAVILAEIVALIAAGTVHRVCITTCFLFSVGLLYEVNKISGVAVSKSESKSKRH
ncbi:hypothetical protein MLD38_001946 [Melastoma candidum]|uniref:Uncharacterized protein n=1 Tax=Melastoma candidum TaxID=119954 RepID=A0ACB9SFA0_9MYRT|nr:hypothetical protein MLD38_001946 [Melastoma candidum]